MRGVRFRAWWKDTMEPIQDFMEEYGLDVLNGLPDNPFIYSQFVGLLDKNGKDIYEGDICRNNRGFDFLIYWHEGECAFRQKGIDMECDYPMNYNQLSVIGNIYENPGWIE